MQGCISNSWINVYTFQEEYTQIVMGVLENRRQYQSIKRKKETKYQKFDFVHCCC